MGYSNTNAVHVCKIGFHVMVVCLLVAMWPVARLLCVVLTRAPDARLTKSWPKLSAQATDDIPWMADAAAKDALWLGVGKMAVLIWAVDWVRISEDPMGPPFAANVLGTHN